MSDSPKNSLDFSDLTPLELPVTIPKTLGGNGRKDGYVLVEASEDAFRGFRTAQSKGASRSDNGTINVGSGMGEADAVLLQKCLFEVSETTTRGGVSLGWVTSLTRRITSELVKQVLAWLVEAEEKDGPKDTPTSTSGTST